KHGHEMIPIDEDPLAGRGIPHLNRPVAAPRGDALAIGRPGDAVDRSERIRCRQHRLKVASIGQDVFPCGSIPYLYSSILTPRGDTCAVGGPAHTTNRTGMPAIDEQRMAPIGAEGGMEGRAGLDERGSRVLK